MPTIFTHTAVPLATGLGLGRRTISPRLLVTGIAASIIPDADTFLHNPYASPYGHRGFTHSLAFAIFIALLAMVAYRYLRTTRICAFLFTFFSCASHGLLDTLTTGGRGVALFWPLSADRFFAPVRVIQVSPMGVTRFFSHSEAGVASTEGLWVRLPAVLLCATFVAIRQRRNNSFERGSY